MRVTAMAAGKMWTWLTVAFCLWLAHIPASLSATALPGLDSLIALASAEESLDPGLAFKRLHALGRQCDSIQDRAGSLQVQLNIANWFSRRGNFDSSYAILKRIEEQSRIDSLLPIRGSILHNLGQHHIAQGEYSRALHYLIQAQSNFQNSGQQKGMAAVYGKLAFIYKAQGHPDRAREYYELACKGFASLHLTKEYVTALHNYGHLLLSLKEFEAADSAFLRVQQASREGGFTQGEDMGEYAHATVLMQQNRLAEAESAYMRVSGSAFIQDNPTRLAGFHINLGTLRLLQKNPADAAGFCEKALDMAVAMRVKELEQSACECLSKTNEDLGNFRQALAYTKRSQALRDSLSSKETQALLESIRAEYDFEKVEKELAQSNLEKERESSLRREAELHARNQSRIRIFLIVVLILVAGFLLYYLFTNRRIRRKNEVIESALAEKEVLLGEVHHRVKNNLQLISSIIDLQARSAHHPPTELLLSELRNRIHAISVLHQQLYQQPDLHAINTAQYLPAILDNLRQTHSSQSGIHLDWNLDEFTMPVGTAISVGLIVSELVTNAFRHAFPPERPQGQVSVALHLTDHRCTLEVQDDGVGSTSGTENFGIKMIRSLARQLKAEIHIVTASGTSTTLQWHIQ